MNKDLKDAALQLLIENQRKAAEESENKEADFSTIFKMSWEDVQDAECLRCKSKTIQRTRGLTFSTYAGAVRCTSCGYRDSVTGYLGKSMIQVEPMPEGAIPFYLDKITGEDTEE